MADLTVEIPDEDLAEALRRAKANGRSLDDELTEILKAGVADVESSGIN